ncbi:MAG TPA: hypothetical protein VMB72_14860 [Acidimicrobiales bacterium]|nr:hypothetical protein [Acidimicrobiales bacterium]
MAATMTTRCGSAPATLHELLERMRRSVVHATLTPDPEAKCALWEQYRLARAEAVALVGRADAPAAG